MTQASTLMGPQSGRRGRTGTGRTGTGRTGTGRTGIASQVWEEQGQAWFI